MLMPAIDSFGMFLVTITIPFVLFATIITVAYFRRR